jgi:hypothetical protein
MPSFFFIMFTLGKGFWGFNNGPSQGMLCLVIGLFRFCSKKIMEGANNC